MTLPNTDTMTEHNSADSAFRELINIYIHSPHRKRVELIERVYKFASEAHKGSRRYTGEDYIMHPLAVAKIVVSEFGLGSTSICAALLHDVLEYTDYTLEDIEDSFGPKIAGIVEGITKISGGIFGEKSKSQGENFRKLLLSMSSDFRVILVKMAERLDNMRNWQGAPHTKLQRISAETLYVYAPLADRLGLNKLKTELEDLAFRHTHPDDYRIITEKIATSRDSRNAIVEEFITPLRKKLDDAGLRYEIKARVKSVWSIYNKMQKKKIPFEEIYDIYAIRVIFENDDDSQEIAICRKIYSLFTEGHMVHPDRLRDWLETPKGNGYRALHVTLMGPRGRWVEVQIRSRKMDDIAELGCAAHWRYKTNEQDRGARLDIWMNYIKEILANPLPEELDYLDKIKLNLFSEEIYVFTRQGHLVILPSGATVLDLAMEIDPAEGLHCVAGKKDHRLIPLSHPLESGDQVELITSISQDPRPNWLNFCRTEKAQKILRDYFCTTTVSSSQNQKNVHF